MPPYRRTHKLYENVYIRTNKHTQKYAHAYIHFLHTLYITYVILRYYMYYIYIYFNQDVVMHIIYIYITIIYIIMYYYYIHHYILHMPYIHTIYIMYRQKDRHINRQINQDILSTWCTIIHNLCFNSFIFHVTFRHTVFHEFFFLPCLFRSSYR